MLRELTSTNVSVSCVFQIFVEERESKLVLGKLMLPVKIESQDLYLLDNLRVELSLSRRISSSVVVHW